MPVNASHSLSLRPLSALTLSLLLAAPLGCYSENEMRNCVTPIEVGVTQPDDGQEYLQGYPLDIEANIRSLCGSSFLEDAIYVVSSDVDGELGGQFLMEDGLLSFHSEQLLALGPHTMTLRADSENAASGEGTVEIVVLENLPPSIEITTPSPEQNEFEASIGVTIHAQVSDPAEPLDSLTLTWILDGITLEEGPAHTDAEGNVAWVLENQAPGCRELRVTVIDSLDQQSSDEAEFVLWADAADLTPYQWWLDEDGDGFGTATGALTSCSQPVGEWLNPTVPDCDDGNSEIYPGRPDYCGDGIDSDCSVLTPAGCSPTGNVAAELSDASISGAYDLVRGIGDINNDGWNDIALGGNAEAMDLIIGPTLGALSADFSFTSGDVHQFWGSLGTSIAGRRDFNGDGIGDLLIGNTTWGMPTSGCLAALNIAGAAHLLLGSDSLQSGAISTTTSTLSLGEADAGDAWSILGLELDGLCHDTYLGTAVTWLPDLDGDNIPDFAISTADANFTQAGAVYIYLSTDAQNIPSGNLVDSNFRLELIGPASDSRLGVSLAGADVDGDGLGDLVIGSLPEDPASGGVVYVVFGRDIPAAQASVTITSIAGMTFNGAHAGAKAGTSVAAVGDLDGDGDEEFLVSAPGERSGDGIVYLVPGFYEVNADYSLEDSFSDLTTPNARGAVRFVGTTSDALRVARSAGDINGDGHTDLLIGAPGNSTGGTSAGAAYLIYGGPSHANSWWDASTGQPQAEILLDAAVAAGTSAARFVSSTTNENLGHSVDRLGDINGDGFDDLIIGASPAGGTVRLFFGGGS